MFVRILGAKVFYLIENKKEKGRKFVSFNLSMLFFLGIAGQKLWFELLDSLFEALFGLLHSAIKLTARRIQVATSVKEFGGKLVAREATYRAQ